MKPDADVDVRLTITLNGDPLELAGPLTVDGLCSRSSRSIRAASPSSTTWSCSSATAFDRTVIREGDQWKS